MVEVGEGQKESYLALLYQSLQRCLEVNRKNEYDLMDGISIVSVILALFENMQGKLDEDLPLLLGFLINEIRSLETLKRPSKRFQSMLLQAISMSFAYNAQLTLFWLESQDSAQEIFKMWFSFMDNFNKDFELRRNIFGLSAILDVPQGNLPPAINDQLP